MGGTQVGRICYAYAAPENADAYEDLLLQEIFPGIRGRNLAGFCEVHAFRRPVEEGEIEFIAILWFDSMEAARGVSDNDLEALVFPVKARALLKRFDARAQHYEMRGGRGRT